MSNPFAAFIAARGIAIVDGALATELERRGADLHDPLWSARVLVEQPALIRAVHDAYFESGRWTWPSRPRTRRHSRDSHAEASERRPLSR